MTDDLKATLDRASDQRSLRLVDLRILLMAPTLSEWGMASLKDTLEAIIPDLELSTIEE